MCESSDGQWVDFGQVIALIESLEARIPELRMAKIEKAIGLVQEGRCIECGQKTQGYEFPTGSFAPEAWATLREAGIDPGSGHLQTCSKKKP